MELLDDSALLPEPIIIQPVDPSFFARLDEGANTKGRRDAVETDTRDANSVAAETGSVDTYSFAVQMSQKNAYSVSGSATAEMETSTGDAYSVMPDHASAAVQITGGNWVVHL